MREKFMEKMDWKEFENELKNVKIVLIPFGSTEEHGFHLPLSTDSLIALELARRLSAKTSIIVAPLIPYGVCRTTASFPGTIPISFESLKALIKDICERFYRQGARAIILLSGHLGTAQMAALTLAAQELTEKFPNLRIAVPNLMNILRRSQKVKEVLEDEKDMHAGEVETSIVLAINEKLVKMDKAEAEHPNFPEHYVVGDTRKYMKSGVMGNALKASKEKGEIFLEELLKGLARLVKDMKEREGTI